jgi:hypothetical protein
MAACGRLVQRVYLRRPQAAGHPKELHVCSLDLRAKGWVHDDCVWPQVLLLLQLTHIAQHKVYLQRQQQRQQGRKTASAT